VTEQLPEDAPRNAKPKTGSLFASMSLEEINLDDALRLMSLPRVVGPDIDGVEITAQNGRYGPYLKKGTDSRSLDNEEQIFTITLDEARAIYAQPKQRGRAAARPPLRELGNDPVSGRPMIIKDGRFGAYVTDGEVNATLRRGDAIETITGERAAALLAEKRAKDPAQKGSTRRAAKKAAPRKSAPAGGTAGRRKSATKASSSKRPEAAGG
jgi:DNA topoisomerase-1